VVHCKPVVVRLGRCRFGGWAACEAGGRAGSGTSRPQSEAREAQPSVLCSTASQAFLSCTHVKLETFNNPKPVSGMKSVDNTLALGDCADTLPTRTGGAVPTTTPVVAGATPEQSIPLP
jgi:hypothetical protein